jgi:hypothetical protein
MTALTRILFCLPLAALLSGCPIYMDAHLLPDRPPTPEESAALAQAVAQEHTETRRTLTAHDWDLDWPVYDPAQERGVDWRLPDRPPPRLQFQGGRLTVQNLCNAVSASYVLEDEGADISIKIGPVMATKRLCTTPGLMELEQRVVAQLPQARHLQMLDMGRGTTRPSLHLNLYFEANDRRWTWTLTGVPTPATRHGSPGERAFLEVAPQTAPCPQPPGAQCLRVRELRYDERGVRQSAGDWRVLPGGAAVIEGFAHEPGFRKVLRVQRFPSASGDPAWVLDMVVATERVE